MALIASLKTGSTNELIFIDSATLGGGGGGTATPLSQTFTAAVNGFQFTRPGTFTAVLITATKNTNGTPSDYAGQAGLTVVSSASNVTTFALTLPAGLDPFTGIIEFQPS